MTHSSNTFPSFRHREIHELVATEGAATSRYVQERYQAPQAVRWLIAHKFLRELQVAYGAVLIRGSASLQAFREEQYVYVQGPSVASNLAFFQDARRALVREGYTWLNNRHKARNARAGEVGNSKGQVLTDLPTYMVMSVPSKMMDRMLAERGLKSAPRRLPGASEYFGCPRVYAQMTHNGMTAKQLSKILDENKGKAEMWGSPLIVFMTDDTNCREIIRKVDRQDQDDLTRRLSAWQAQNARKPGSAGPFPDKRATLRVILQPCPPPRIVRPR